MIMKINLTVLFSLLLSITIIQTGLGDAPDYDKILEAKSQIESDFISLHAQHTNPTELSQVYNQFLSEGVIKLSKVNPREIMQETSKKLSNLLMKEIEALRTAVRFAEDEAAAYRWNPNLQADNVEYLNAKTIEWRSERMEYSSVFGQRIVHNESTVHIPTEIYEGDDVIVKGIDYTKDFDKVFLENSKKLKYQIYADGDGFMRIFPGMKWRNKGVDMYDVRKQPWFVEGSSSPKDVMILIDTSGSMHGQSLQMVQMAVKRLIRTLSENDYIGVAQFPGKFRSSVDPNGLPHDYYPHFIVDKGKNVNTSCFKTFVQASKRNVQRVFEQINSLEANGIAELAQAVEFAFYSFQQFDDDHESNQGANCNRIILIVTDGGIYYPEDTVQALYVKYPKLENVRIFTYSVGEDNSYSEVLQKLACDNRGHFSNIPAVGAVSSIIQTYLREVHHHTSINVYEDVSERKPQMTIYKTLPEKYLSKWHQGLGIMTSLTLPVFNRTGNDSLLGLMSTDVTVSDMQNLIPKEKLGPNGYGFAVNMNGYLIFHPAIRLPSEWMHDSPNVDFLEVEYPSPEKEELRRNLIDMGATGRKTIEEVTVHDLIELPDDIHAYKGTRTYIYTSMPHSPFGLALVFPKENDFYLEFQQDKYKLKEDSSEFTVVSAETGEAVMKLNTQDFGLLLSHAFEYCAVNVSLDLYYRQLAQRFEAEAGGNGTNSTDVPAADEDPDADLELPAPPPGLDRYSFDVLRSVADNYSACVLPVRCGEEVCEPYDSFRHRIAALLLDLLATQRFMEARAPDWRKAVSEARILSAFVTTNVGVTRFFPRRPEMSFKEVSRVPKSALYQRAYEMKDDLIFAVEFKKGVPSQFSYSAASDSVLMLKSVTTSPGTKYRFAAAGVEVTQAAAQELLTKSSLCGPASRQVCLLLDDGGYVISHVNVDNGSAAYLPRMVGYFFGYVYPQVMNHFVNNSVFDTVEEYDYQAVCERKETASAGAFIWRRPLLATAVDLLASVANYFSVCLHFVVHLLCASSLPGSEAIHDKPPEPPQKYSCITLAYRYAFVPREKPFVGSVECDSSVISVSATPLRGTNLVLVTVPDNFTCAGADYPPRDAKEDEGPCLCARATHPRYRQRPHQCFPYQADEENPLCLADVPRTCLTLLALALLLHLCLR